MIMVQLIHSAFNYHYPYFVSASTKRTLETSFPYLASSRAYSGDHTFTWNTGVSALTWMVKCSLTFLLRPRLCQNLFDLTIEEVKENVNAWSPEVKLFRVSDSHSGKLLGHFYFDPYIR